METVAVDWNLDVAGAQQLEGVVGSLSGIVVVDLTNSAFVASSGLRVLLKHAQRLNDSGGKLAVCGVNPTVAEVFSISGFDSIIESFDDADAAGAALEGGTD